MSETFSFRVNKEEAEILNAFLKWAQTNFGYDTNANTMKGFLLDMAHDFAIPKTSDLIFPTPNNKHEGKLCTFDGLSDEQAKRLEQLSEQSGKPIAYILAKGTSAGLQKKRIHLEDL